MSESRYDKMLVTLRDILIDVDTMAGDTIADPPMAWQDVAKRLSGNLRMYVHHLEYADSEWDDLIVFPSVSDAREEA